MKTERCYNAIPHSKQKLYCDLLSVVVLTLMHTLLFQIQNNCENDGLDMGNNGKKFREIQNKIRDCELA